MAFTKSVFGLAIAALVAVLSGCSDPKAASTRNFEKAAQAYLDSKYPYCYFTGSFPAEIKKDTMRFGNDTEIFSALADVGLLSARQETIEEAVPSLFSREEPEMREVEVTIYELTDEGRKYYEQDAKKDNWRGKTVGGFCFGKAKLIGVDRYTEPADVGLGFVVSKVRYRYKVGDFPEWAKDERILAQSRELRRDLASRDEPIIEEYAMILTNEGWIHEKNMD